MFVCPMRNMYTSPIEGSFFEKSVSLGARAGDLDARTTETMSATEHKDRGNEHFKNARWDDAVAEFTRAIELDGTNHVFYSNRSAAHAGAERWREALADAEKTISLKPDWAKGYGRKGAALFGARDLEGAKEAYAAGLAIEPENALLKSGLEDVEHVSATRQQADDGMNQIGSMFRAPDLMGKLATNPATRDYLSQPDFLTMMSEVQRDPNSLNKYLSDPRMMNVLSVAMGVKVMSGDDAAKEFGEHEADSKPTVAAAESKPAPPPEPKAPEPVKEPEPEVSETRKEALAAKEAGNAAYKKRDFDTAIANYDKAIELDPEDVSFLNNRAAANLEKGDYVACISDCDTAIEKGRSTRADYTVIAKAMTRKGNALVKQGELEAAIDTYQRSLTEHRTADTLKRLNDTEKKLKDAQQAAYLDPVKGDEARERGNTFFKEQKFPEAVKEYTEAIARNPNDHKAYSNRSASYTKLTAFNEALKDAEKCIDIDPTFVKGYTRKGHVQFFTKQYDEALETYTEGLKHDPSNEELKDGMRRCHEQINRGATGQLTEEELKQRQERAMSNPEIQGILSDPVMRQVLQDMSTDPKAAAEHQRNPTIMAKIQKLINAGIVQVR